MSRKTAWIVGSPDAIALLARGFQMCGDFVSDEGKPGETRLIGYTNRYKKRLSVYESTTLPKNEVKVNNVASVLMSRRDRARIEIKRRVYRRIPGFRWLEKFWLTKIHHPQGWWKDDEESGFVFGTLTEIVRKEHGLKYERH